MNHTEWEKALTTHKAIVEARILTLKGEAGTNGNGRASDTVDNANDSNEERQRIRTLEQLMQANRKIDELLGLEENSYQVCHECGDEIPERRLEALLSETISVAILISIRRCLECAEKREQSMPVRRRSELMEVRASS